MAHKRFFYGNFDNIFRLFCRPSPSGGVLADANIVTVLKNLESTDYQYITTNHKELPEIDKK